MEINYENLRELFRETPEIKRLLIERQQIKQDSKKRSNYTKPAPHLTPSNDKYHHKKHMYDKSKDPIAKKETQKKLAENAKQMEKTIQATLKKMDDIQSIEGLKEMNIRELVIFLEKGRDKVLESRLPYRERNPNPKKQLDRTQDSFNQKIEDFRASQEKKMSDRLQRTIDKTKKEFEKNKGDIEQDRGLSL